MVSKNYYDEELCAVILEEQVAGEVTTQGGEGRDPNDEVLLCKKFFLAVVQKIVKMGIYSW